MSRQASSQQGDVPRAVERVLDLLEIVLGGDPCTLTEAATAAGLTPTTTLRYLRALETRHWLHREADGRFHPGAAIVHLAADVHRRGPLDRVIAIAQPHLDALAERSGESVYLVMSGGRRATYVATAAGPRAIRHVGWVGQQLPLRGTAAGAALRRPGTPAVRTGAVEPDITAVSLALPRSGPVGLAVSIVGPDQRLAGAACTNATAHLIDTVGALAAELGLDRDGPATPEAGQSLETEETGSDQSG